jgi:hypothetical protein
MMDRDGASGDSTPRGVHYQAGNRGTLASFISTVESGFAPKRMGGARRALRRG